MQDPFVEGVESVEDVQRAAFSEPQNLRATDPQRAALRQAQGKLAVGSGQLAASRKKNSESRIQNSGVRRE